MIKPKKKPEIKLLRRITPMRKKRQQQSMKCLRSDVTFLSTEYTNKDVT